MKTMKTDCLPCLFYSLCLSLSFSPVQTRYHQIWYFELWLQCKQARYSIGVLRMRPLHGLCDFIWYYSCEIACIDSIAGKCLKWLFSTSAVIAAQLLCPLPFILLSYTLSECNVRKCLCTEDCKGAVFCFYLFSLCCRKDKK